MTAPGGTVRRGAGAASLAAEDRNETQVRQAELPSVIEGATHHPPPKLNNCVMVNVAPMHNITTMVQW